MRNLAGILLRSCVDEAPPLRALFCDDFRSVNGAGVGADDDLRRELTGFA